MRAIAITPWAAGATGEDGNEFRPALADDYSLPLGGSWTDISGQAVYQIPTQPDAYIVSVSDVPQPWIDTVSSDSNYLVIWSGQDVPGNEEPTQGEIDAIRAYFSDRQNQVEYYTAVASYAELVESIRGWTNGFLRQDSMDPEDYAALVARYPTYEVGVDYVAGQVVADAGVLYEIVQPHTSQVDYVPATTPSLYTLTVPEGVIPEWVQPTGAQDAYDLGQRVTHNGVIWQSLIGANVWEPGTDASLWKQVSEVVEPTGWVDSGETVTDLIGAGVIGVTDTAPFAADQLIRIDGVHEATVSSIFQAGAPGILVITPHVNVSGGESIEVWQ